MQNAPVFKGHRVAAHLRARVSDLIVDDPHIVKIAVEPAFERGRVKAGVIKNAVIRIDDQRVINPGHRAQMRQGRAAVGGEISPGFVDHLTRNAMFGEIIADDLLGAVGGAGVFDQHIIDQRAAAFEATADHPGLVFHDHAQPDGGGAILRGGLRCGWGRAGHRGFPVVD